MKRLIVLILTLIIIAIPVNAVNAENERNKSEQSVTADKESSCDQINSYLLTDIYSWDGFVHLYGARKLDQIKYEEYKASDGKVYQIPVTHETIKIDGGWINPYNMSIVSDRPKANTIIEECVVRHESNQEILITKRFRIILSIPEDFRLWERNLQEFREWYDKRYSTNTSPSS